MHKFALMNFIQYNRWYPQYYPEAWPTSSDLLGKIKSLLPRNSLESRGKVRLKMKTVLQDFCLISGNKLILPTIQPSMDADMLFLSPLQMICVFIRDGH